MTSIEHRSFFHWFRHVASDYSNNYGWPLSLALHIIPDKKAQFISWTVCVVHYKEAKHAIKVVPTIVNLSTIKLIENYYNQVAKLNQTSFVTGSSTTNQDKVAN